MIKRVINKIGRMSPDSIARLIVNIPFEFRFGKVYDDFNKKIIESKEWNEDQLEDYIVTHFNKVFQHAKKFKLYEEKYKKSGVFDLEVKNIEDIKKIPILTRSEIRESISDFNGNYPAKTSGTSGNPLSIFLDKDVWAREWAHYHYIWGGQVGYKYTDAKFVIKRQNLKNKFLEYYCEHNEYVINTYQLTNNDIDEFFKVLTTKNVKYFHGYPSSIYSFLKEIEFKISISQKKKLKKQIKCCFFCSEMPLPHITDYIRNVWALEFIACYGHTETCVLGAADKNGLEYVPLHTYGYVEVENNKLLGTSYHNYNMPLIRYNTDDLVRPKRYTNGILKSFKVKEGRVFDYIIDKNDLKIAYVGLFLERDHEIWKHIDYFQVHQKIKGHVTILISQNRVDDFDALPLMNLDDFDFDFDFLYLKEPLRTASGKVPLRVSNLP